MTRLWNRSGCLVLALALGSSLAARGDEPPSVVFPAESKPTAARIDGIRQLLAAHKWPDAVAEIQAVLTASGDDLVAVSPGRSVACRQLCHAMLATLPAEALRSYREGVDPEAKKWLDQATAGRDVRLLHKVVDETFCSKPGEKALDLLGDFAFEQGDFAEAERWWSYLIPPRTGKEEPPSLVLYYPDPRIDPARTRAKLLLARLFRGAYGWADDLDAYRKDYPKSEGELAGKKGLYADILRQVADERNADAPAPTADWPTFGGDPSRGAIAVAPPRLLERLGALCRPANERQFSLKDRKPLDEDPVYDRGAGPVLANRSMAFEPVVADGKAIVADANFVTAYDLRTGAVETWYDAARLNGGVHSDLKLPAPPDLRYTLTVAGDRVYVRLGTQTVRDAPTTDKPKEDEKQGPPDDVSLLVCLSLRPGADGSRFLWSIDPSAPEDRDRDKAYAVFEGAPLVHDGRLYIASTCFVNGRPVTRVHCHPADAAERPQELWHQDLCETREFADRDRRYRQHLLTLAGPCLVYCSHSGAVAALDALTGKPAWAVRYPSRGDKTADNDPSPRDLAPCLFADGRLYVAPADYDHILCLDPATGEKLWDRGPVEVVQLLGVGADRLIFTTPSGLRAVGPADGVDAWALPDGGGSLPPAGRGLLVGDLVLWPTASKGPGSFEVYAVRQRDGEQPDDPSLLSRIPAGNLVYADGCLLSADRQVLTLFAPPGMQLEEKEKRSRAEADSPAAALDLARAEADDGLTARALEDLGRAERLAAALSPAKQRRLDEAVRSEKHVALMDAARRVVAARRWEDAADFFKQASAAEFAAPVRLQTQLEEAATWKAVGQAYRAVAVWQGVRSADEFRNLIVEDDNGIPQSAAAFAAARLGQAPKAPAPTVIAEAEPRSTAEPPYFRRWQATLDRGESALAVVGDLLVCGRDRPSGGLTARSTETGALRWQMALPFAPTWAGRCGDVIVTAGAGGAAGLRAEDGRIAWTFAAPPPSWAFPTEEGTVLGPTDRADPLGNFHLLGGVLCLVQGDLRVFALDAESGRVQWTRRAPGAGLRQPYPDGRFFHVDPAGGVLLVQTSGGRRWLLDAATGRILHDDATATESWPRDPVPLPDGGILVTTDARTVEWIEPASGRDVWTYTLPGVTTRTGEAPKTVVGPDAVLIAWAENIGWRIQRLDRATGKPAWDDPPLVNAGALDVEGWSQDADAFYGVQDRVLVARSLKDGAVLWRQPTAGPPGRWRTQRVGGALLAYPVETRGSRFQFRWLLGALQWEGRLPLEEESGRGFPALCCEPKTGRLVERLNFPVVPRVFARLDYGPALALPSFRAASVEGSPLVCPSSHGLTVALGGRVWGLAAK